jgi:uncharacterized protein YtpQ (UPF0354 family)
MSNELSLLRFDLAVVVEAALLTETHEHKNQFVLVAVPHQDLERRLYCLHC